MSEASKERFEDAVREAEEDLYRYFMRRINNPSDAAEAYGELLLTAWRRRRRMPTRADQARMWLFGVAHNILRSNRRSKARYANALQRLTLEAQTAPPPESTEQAVEIRGAIAVLPPDQAELIRLVYWDGFPSHEAAAILGLNPSTARSRIAAARAKLRLLLTVDTSEPKGLGVQEDDAQLEVGQRRV